MSRKIVFFDIDGTLLDRQIGVPKSTKQALKQLKENGHIAILCTGRTKPAIDCIDEVMGLPFDGIIAGAGTYVEYKQQEVISKIMSDDHLDKLVALLKEINARYTLEGPKHMYYVEPLSKHQKQFMKLYFKDKEVFQRYEKGNAEVHKLFMEQYDMDAFHRLLPEFQKLMEIIYYEKHQEVEMVHKGYSKAEGIKILLKYLKLPLENTYAFGDGPNDLEMLAYVAYGTAMGNSEPIVLQRAKYQTVPITEDGIYHGLKKFGLI